MLFLSLSPELNSAKIKAIITYSKRCRLDLQLILKYPLSGIFCAGHDVHHGLFQNCLCLRVTSDTGNVSQSNLVVNIWLLLSVPVGSAAASEIPNAPFRRLPGGGSCGKGSCTLRGELWSPRQGGTWTQRRTPLPSTGGESDA